MIRNEGVFLGYYENLIEFLSYHPHGIAGGCFVNGETLSLWVWDYVSRVWIDSNRPSNWLSGLVDDPETFVPEHKTGVQTAYMFLAETQGHIVFTHFVNDDVPLSIDVEGVSVVMLFWNGDYWEYRVALVSEDNLSDYAKKDLSNVSADVLREKAGVYEVLCVAYDVDEDHLVSFAEGEDAGSVVGTVAESQSNVLFFTSTSGLYGSGIAPVAVKIVYPHGETEGMSFVATFVGVDDYVHRIVFDEGGALSQQDAYRIDDFALDDLSNVDSSAFRNKNIYPVSSFVYWVDGDHTVTLANAEALAQILYGLSGVPDSLLYAEGIAAEEGDIGLSPVSFALMAEDPIDYSLSFFGNDEYLHVLRVNGLGAITRQYAYRIDDLATKSFITSSGYRPIRVIDLGIYQNGEFSLNGTPYFGDMQTSLYSYLDGNCGMLLRAHNQYNEPLVFVPTRIYRSGDTIFVMEFMVSATQLCEIRIDEDADVEGGESLFSQQFTAIGSGGSGGSGTVTTESYSDINDYNEVK